MTSGTRSSERNALELSINTAPDEIIFGANFFARSEETAPRTKSSPEKSAPSAFSKVTSLPIKVIILPALRSEAKSLILPAGNLRSESIFIISLPTAPVAPRMPMLYVFINCLSQIVVLRHYMQSRQSCCSKRENNAAQVDFRRHI